MAEIQSDKLVRMRMLRASRGADGRRYGAGEIVTVDHGCAHMWAITGIATLVDKVEIKPPLRHGPVHKGL